MSSHRHWVHSHVRLHMRACLCMSAHMDEFIPIYTCVCTLACVYACVCTMCPWLNTHVLHAHPCNTPMHVGMHACLACAPECVYGDLVTGHADSQASLLKSQFYSCFILELSVVPRRPGASSSDSWPTGPDQCLEPPVLGLRDQTQGLEHQGKCLC